MALILIQEPCILDHVCVPQRSTLDVAYKITEAVFEHLDTLQKAFTAFRDTKL
jgi:hypothetical protein